jgi:hypothetical protein
MAVVQTEYDPHTNTVIQYTVPVVPEVMPGSPVMSYASASQMLVTPDYGGGLIRAVSSNYGAPVGEAYVMASNPNMQHDRQMSNGLIASGQHPTSSGLSFVDHSGSQISPSDYENRN